MFCSHHYVYDSSSWTSATNTGDSDSNLGTTVAYNPNTQYQQLAIAVPGTTGSNDSYILEYVYLYNSDLTELLYTFEPAATSTGVNSGSFLIQH